MGSAVGGSPGDGGNVVEGTVRDSNTAIERWVKEKACAATEPTGPF